MFRRPEHRLIAEALAAMNAPFLIQTRCYFGGGTAIVLQNGEYRLSLDVDFLCADRDGYRELRTAVTRHGTAALFGPEVRTIREFRTDHYGLRALLSLREQPIKFEIIREARVELQGALSPLGVPVLALADQVTEKLLANADRCLDRSVAYRDAIDLGYLLRGTQGRFPADAVAKAEAAYGEDVGRKLFQVLDRLAAEDERRYAAATLRMPLADADAAVALLRAATQAVWPEGRFGDGRLDPRG
jgi:hypothetical protein